MVIITQMVVASCFFMESLKVNYTLTANLPQHGNMSLKLQNLVNTRATVTTLVDRSSGRVLSISCAAPLLGRGDLSLLEGTSVVVASRRMWSACF